MTASSLARIARFYDDDYRDYDRDIPFIAALARQEGGPILELGSGSGRVLLPLAQQGHQVTGLDVSPDLMALARQKLAGRPWRERVTLIEDDFRTADLKGRTFRFAFSTSNTFMHVTDPEEQLQTLQNVHRHLATGGLLMLDFFNPDVARLTEMNGVQELADRWTSASTSADVIKWSVRTVDWAAQTLETLFIYEEFLPDGTSRRTLCPFILRFLWPNEAELMLRAAGFTVEAILGDFDGDPYHSGSERLILLARKDEA